MRLIYRVGLGKEAELVELAGPDQDKPVPVSESEHGVPIHHPDGDNGLHWARASHLSPRRHQALSVPLLNLCYVLHVVPLYVLIVLATGAGCAMRACADFLTQKLNLNRLCPPDGHLRPTRFKCGAEAGRIGPVQPGKRQP